MTTTVTLTGTGTPMLVPGLAGPGVLVQTEQVAVQIDAGRGTVVRLADLGVDPTRLSAVLVTHHHSDHMVGLADLLMTRWLGEVTRKGQTPLPVVAPEGPAGEIARHILDVWEEEIQLRRSHTARPDHSSPDVLAFAAAAHPVEVFRRGEVVVDSVAVHHEPVVPAVAYRITTADGVVVVSGDTVICDEVERLAHDADVLVHEAFRREGVAGLLSDPDAIAAYHAEAADVGSLAKRAGVSTLMLTHLIPPLRDLSDAGAFEADIAGSGFRGELIVGRDLASVVL